MMEDDLDWCDGLPGCKSLPYGINRDWRKGIELDKMTANVAVMYKMDSICDGNSSIVDEK